MPKYTHPVFKEGHLLKTYGKNIRAFGDRVLIAKLPKDRLTEHGDLIIPMTANRISSLRNNYGQVISIGEDVKEVEKGWVVKWGDYSGMDVNLESHFDLIDKTANNPGTDTLPQDRDYVVLREHEIELAFLLEEGEPIPMVHDV